MLASLPTDLRRDADRPALLGRRTVTRGQLADLVDGYANALHHRGLGAGDTLGLAVRPGGHAFALLLAAYRLGIRVAVLDPSAGPDVLTARLALATPALIAADALAQAAAGLGVLLPRLPRLGPVATVGPRLPGCAPVLAPRGGPPPAGHDGDGDAVVVFTSGTTSRPRAVVHSRSSLSAGMHAVAELVAPRAGRPVLGGTSFVLVPALASGAPVALPARRPRHLTRQLRLLSPQATYLTPPAIRAALRAGARFTGRVWSGSAPVSAELLDRIVASGATEAWGVYALTELFPAAAVSATDKHSFDGDGDLVGAPLPGVRARVEDGQLLLAGPAACDRYLGEPSHEWIATGDVARLDGGRIVLAGRCKDMILRGAENIYPGLYEPALHVPGVDLAVLVGVPAGDGDERLVALVEPAAGADPRRIRAALAGPLARMGSARPDAVVLGPVPLSGRSRKPDRVAAARTAARLVGAR